MDTFGHLWTLFILVLDDFCSIGAASVTRCGLTEYNIVNASGFVTCLPCPQCSGGYEVIPRCGATLNSNFTAFKCKACDTGFFKASEDQAPFCERCGLCRPHQIYMKKCTPKSDTVCGNCQRGYVVSPDLVECYPCCRCTGDKKEVKDSRCEPPRECLPDSSTGMCLNETENKLGPKDQNKGGPHYQGGQNQPIYTHDKPTSHWSHKLFVISIALAGGVLLFGLLAIISILRKRRREAYKTALIGAVFSSESRSSLVPFASSSTYSTIDVPSLVNCPIKSCREVFGDELIQDVRMSCCNKFEFCPEEARRLYRSLLDTEPPKEKVTCEDLLTQIEMQDHNFKISTLIYYLQEIDRNDILRAIHVSLHQDSETVPLAENC